MTTSGDRLLLWTPRVLGTAMCAFLGAFALDAFGPGKPIVQALIDFTIHLAPALVLFAVVIVSLRHEWIGGVAFATLGLAYALSTRRVDWIAVISGPLLAVSVLYFWSWSHTRRLLRQP